MILTSTWALQAQTNSDATTTAATTASAAPTTAATVPAAATGAAGTTSASATTGTTTVTAMEATTGGDATAQWNTNPAHWERVLQVRKADGVSLGNSDWKATGPIINNLRRNRTTGRRTFRERLTSVPIVGLFVPQPIPNPPGGGRYFLWGESDRPWTAVGMGAAAGDPSNPTTHESKGYLISVSR